MKKSFLLALFLLCSFCSCGGDDESDDNNGAECQGANCDGGSSQDAGNDAGGQEGETEWDETERLVDYVNPAIGTGGQGYGVGSAFMGATAPFGMAKPGPDTSSSLGAGQFTHCSGYYYEDEFIQGFSHIHLHGTGVPDYGNILFMPTIGMNEYKHEESGYRSKFDKKTEFASPGYYAVTLADTDIGVELTSAEHTAFHKYTFNDSNTAKDATVIIDLAHVLTGGECTGAEIELSAEAGTAEGYMHNNGGISNRSGGFDLFFYAKFDVTPTGFGVFSGDEILDQEPKAEGNDIGGYFTFDASKNNVINVIVGISFISVEQAKLNMETESKDKSFEEIKKETEEKWESELSVIRVKGGTKDQKIMLYTALYHAYLMPTLFTDANGKYMGFDHQVHNADGFTYYSDFSMWDTYRSEHPLLILLQPERERDMVISLIKMYEQGGYIPKWPLALGYTNTMIGTPADVVIADTYLKGITDFDVEKAYEGVRATATAPTPSGAPYSGRGGIESYINRGYVASDENNSATSCTQEYSIDDFALSNLAEKLGKTEDAEMFAERSKNYKNLYDPETGFFRGKKADGTWDEDFSEKGWKNYYDEGNAWQYLWLAPHDAEGLAELMGGKDKMIERLDNFFEMSKEDWDNNKYGRTLPLPYYWHSNEPDIHTAYFYADLGKPAESQNWVRWVLETNYGTGPDGIPGNDDCGTMSAWYVFSALGFYPVSGKTDYIIGSPIFEKAKIEVNGKRFIISAENASSKNIYIQSAVLNSQELTKPYLSHFDIIEGGELKFKMANSESKWGEF